MKREYRVADAAADGAEDIWCKSGAKAKIVRAVELMRMASGIVSVVQGCEL
jgi:hypothetical protein